MFTFDNSYARLPEAFFERIAPTPVSDPTLIKVNKSLALQLGLDAKFLTGLSASNFFSGNEISQGSEPIAMAYSGHQFGGWNPQLGDGRAVLLGEVVDQFGVRQDVQLKGSGRTRFSRSGDGRAWIGPVLREYVISEAMQALNIPTTRALAVVMTGENVYREQRVPGAILTRVSRSHIRVGTFQYFVARNDLDALKTLADYVIERHFPELKDAQNPYLGLLESMVSRQAALIALWMGVGFIHGVMNTDNTLISGETIDYGPCAFMDAYDPNTVFSSIDHMGRYSYGNQPHIGQTNCAYFASCLLPLISSDEDEARESAIDALNTYEETYKAAWAVELNAKIGLASIFEGDAQLGDDLLDCMARHKVDFTQTFRALTYIVKDNTAQEVELLKSFKDDVAFKDWLSRWRTRLTLDGTNGKIRQAAMQGKNAAYIPRNHQVEAMIAAALDENFEPFETLLDVLETPFEDRADYQDYQHPPAVVNDRYQTFCGT